VSFHSFLDHVRDGRTVLGGYDLESRIFAGQLGAVFFFECLG